MSLTVSLSLTTEEVAQIRKITCLQDDAAAVAKAAKEYLRINHLRELKSATGKVEYEDVSVRLESLEMSENDCKE